MAIRFPTCVESLTLLAGHTPRAQDYLRLCYLFSWDFSQDSKTKNGSVLVTSDGQLHYGCNHLPDGIQVTPDRLADPTLKDPLIEHAETDAILRAGRTGSATQNGVLYCAWAPCIPCARTIITAGVRTVITHKQAHDRTYEKYLSSVEQAVSYLQEASVQYQRFDGPVGGCQGLMNHEEWSP